MKRLTATLIASTALALPMVAGCASSPSPAPHNAYQDCLSLAKQDNFAPEVCEPLSPDSYITRVDCAHDPSLRGTVYCKDVTAP